MFIRQNLGKKLNLGLLVVAFMLPARNHQLLLGPEHMPFRPVHCFQVWRFRQLPAKATPRVNYSAK